MSSTASPGRATPASGPCWFIYYRVQLADLARAVAAARDGQQRLCRAHPGLTAELMQRPSSTGSPPQMTVLETYRVPAGWPVEQARALPADIERVQAGALAPWLQGSRHLEAFEPCA
jgi:hypothetical protein